jgi:hypothetical protein
MVEQTLCPNCGQQMDVSYIYRSGSAQCAHCGYSGLPIKQSEYMQKLGKKDSKKTKRRPSADPLDIRTLMGKLAIVWAGVLVMSMLMPEMKTFVPVSILGLLLFVLSYKFLEKKEEIAEV